MSDQPEIERVRRGGLSSDLPSAKWEFNIDLGHSPDDVWGSIIAVVEHIVAFEYDNWPDDAYWSETLPGWLKSTMMTPEECAAATAQTPRERWGELPWEFGSWLDAIRERDWRWWDYARSGSRVRLVLQIMGIPPRIDAFRQVLLAAGAKILSEEHD
jgi:hypothetical protein